MDLGRLVFMDIKAKRYRSALKELPDETIKLYAHLEKQTLNNKSVLCELTFLSYAFQIEVYSISNKIQGGVNLNVSYIGENYGKKIDFKEPEGAENVEGSKGTLSFDYKGVHYLLTKTDGSCFSSVL